MRICFYAALEDPHLFELVEFYRQDIRALRTLGHEVRLVTNPRGLWRGDDAYWVWWPTSGAPAVLAARLRRRPVVLVTAISDRDRTIAGFRSRPPWTIAAARFSMAAAGLILATSDDTRQGLTRYGIKRLWTAPLGVDTDFYRPMSDGRESKQIVTISHLTRANVERKRILDVVRTAALLRERHPSVRFVIAGEHGDGAASVYKEVQRLGIEDVVSLPGQVSTEDKRRLLATATVYFQPTRYEAFGLAIAEAMACATPVLTCAVGAVPEVVGAAGRLMDESTEPDGFADALDTLLGDPTRAALGTLGRARVERKFSYATRRRIVEEALAAVDA